MSLILHLSDLCCDYELLHNMGRTCQYLAMEGWEICSLEWAAGYIPLHYFLVDEGEKPRSGGFAPL